MSDSSPNIEVNQHYLDRVVETSAVRHIEASEDIFSSTGIKLVAKGAQISQGIQDRLIIHKLKKPLELCLTVKDGVEVPHLVEQAEQIYALTPALQPLLDPKAYTTSLKAIECNKETNNLLTVQAGRDNRGLFHNVMVSMVASSIAAKLHCSENRIQSVALASLLHDIGELYINPQYLDNSRQLSLDEWRHISAHPIIGHKLVSEVCRFTKEAATAIFEHHERGNGFGYPCATSRHEQSLPGQILAAAELLVSFASNNDHPLERAELALRIVPREFNQEIFSVVSRAIDRKNFVANAGAKPVDADLFRSFFLQIGAVSEALLHIEDHPRTSSASFMRLLERATERFQMIQRSFSSTGLDYFKDQLQQTKLVDDTSDWLSLEMELIVKELRWRLKELARDISIRMYALNEAEIALFTPLVEALHKSHYTPST